MNYVGKRTTVQTSWRPTFTPIKKIGNAALNFATRVSGIDAFPNAYNKLTSGYLGKEVETPKGREYKKLDLEWQERVGLAIGELIYRTPQIALVGAPILNLGCNIMDEDNVVCDAAQPIAKLEKMVLNKAKTYTLKGLELATPYVKEGFKLLMRGMEREDTYILTHLALWGSGTYCGYKAWKTARSDLRTIYEFNNRKIERKPRKIRSTARKICQSSALAILGVALIGISVSHTAGWINHATVSNFFNSSATGGTPKPKGTP